ncbi:hypothetical protein [Stutzerimonas stutzeri]|uniref:hypothetical protein n=1 Tax=Stutzerimonas stutzeri TaxID=316 RepID=UPI00210D345A|nr:hypothetical protein [Stutzerimonas stutzeri]MCQ4318996.1 hypothetical protein [Stutzerimonas stutzeri]
MSACDYSPAQRQHARACATGFFPDIGCALLAYGPPHATLALTLLPRHLNNVSTMHGGVMATLRVVAMGPAGRPDLAIRHPGRDADGADRRDRDPALAADHAQRSPWRIAVGWNGRFVLSVLFPLLLMPLLA